MDNGGIHRFSNFHYTSPYLTRYRCAASKIAREEVDQRADERVVTIAFLDQLLKPDYAHALSIELPSIVSPPVLPRFQTKILLPSFSSLDHHRSTRSPSPRPPFETVLSNRFKLSYVPPMDGRKSGPVVSAWISIAPGFLAITKQEIRSRRERESVCVCVCEIRGQGQEQRKRGGSLSLSLFGSEAKYSERADRVRVTVN